MERKIKIAIFLHTTIGDLNGIYFIKDILNSYFNELNKLADITLVGTIEPKSYFHGSILNESIKTSLLSPKSNKNLYEKLKNTYCNIKQSDIVFLFMPSMSSVFAAIICYISNKPFISYFGANWYDLEKSSSKRKSKKAIIYKILSNFVSKKSLFSLHTGINILECHKGVNKYLTSPILNFSPELFYKRQYYSNLLNTDKINILYVGNLEYNKGISYLLKAIKEIQNPKIHLQIIGDGIDKYNFELMCEDFGIKNQVDFLGFIKNGPELFNYYKNSDIFILPSLSEGLPRVLYEAAGNGCTIITTPVNSIPYVFKNEYDCLFIQPEDHNTIVEALNRIIQQKNLNQYLSENAYKTVTPILKNKASEQHFKLILEHLK